MPRGCVTVGGAFSAGFSSGFDIGGLLCGPYYSDEQGMVAVGSVAAQLLGEDEGDTLPIHKRTVIAGSTQVLLDRINTIDAEPIEIAGTASVNVRVVDLLEDEERYIEDFDPADVIHDDMIGAPRWTQDSIGANCLVVLPDDAIPETGRTYAVTITVTPVGSDDVLKSVWHLQTVGLDLMESE